MITLHILKLLEDNGFGTIDTNLFFEKLTLDNKGLYISSRGAPLSRGQRKTQAFDIYARGNNDVDPYKQLEEVLAFLEESYTVCDLPTVPGISSTEYVNCSIQPTSNIENAGLDPGNRVIYVLSGQITYQIKEN